jgi:hypothetical protein
LVLSSFRPIESLLWWPRSNKKTAIGFARSRTAWAQCEAKKSKRRQIVISVTSKLVRRRDAVQANKKSND